MSLVYRLLGIPRTFEEFVDKAAKKGHRTVNVVLNNYDDEGSSWNYHVLVSLQVENIRLKLLKYTHVRMGDLHATVIGKAEIEKTALERAVEAAEQLRERGFEVTIQRKPLDAARDAIALYREQILNKKREFGMAV